jgi:hypothetical protein
MQSSILGKATTKLLGVLLAVPMTWCSTNSNAENRLLDVKTGYCYAQSKAPSTNMAICHSQIYYFRERDKSIYICSVISNVPGGAIDKVPSEIGCFKIGNAPISGEISLRSIGDRLITLQKMSTPADGDLYMYSWRSGYWVASDSDDGLAFCVLPDQYGTPPPVQCVTKIDWNKYIPIQGLLDH